MMKLPTKYWIEGIVVLFVLMILLYVSIPRFVKSQKIQQIKNVEMLVKTLRDMCIENPEFLQKIESNYLLAANSYQNNRFARSVSSVYPNYKSRFVCVYVNAKKIMQEVDEINISDELAEDYYYFIAMYYLLISTSSSVRTDEFPDTPIYFSLTATNQYNLNFSVVPDSITINRNGNFHVRQVLINPFDITNGLNSIGSFTYNSQEAMPMPKAVNMK